MAPVFSAAKMAPVFARCGNIPHAVKYCRQKDQTRSACAGAWRKFMKFLGCYYTALANKKFVLGKYIFLRLCSCSDSGHKDVFVGCQRYRMGIA